MKETDTSRCTKVETFQDPIVAVKVQKCLPDSNDMYERAYIPFLSMPSYNITTVNSLNVIKMNNVRSLYHSMYCTIDNVDKLVKFCKLKHCS